MHMTCCLPVLQHEGDTVRFRNSDIPRMTQMLAACRLPLSDLIGSADESTKPRQTAPSRCALASCQLPLPSNMRKDARYCCRKHQLADRHRGDGKGETNGDPP
jgi:hypothetical protein